MPDAPRVGEAIERPLGQKRKWRSEAFSSDSEEESQKKVKSKAEPQRKVLKPSHQGNRTKEKHNTEEREEQRESSGIAIPKLSKKAHSLKPSKRVVCLPKEKPS